MKEILKRLCTGVLALATVVTALPSTPVHASETQYWTESVERVGIVERVNNDGSITETFNEGHLTVEGKDAYCIDINTAFKNGYKTRADASTRMSAGPDKRRCLIYRICKTVHRQPQWNKQQSRLPFKTACCLAEIKRTSWLAMR